MDTEGEGHRHYALHPTGRTQSLPYTTSAQILYGLAVDAEPDRVVSLDVETTGLDRDDRVELIGVAVSGDEEYAVILHGEDADRIACDLIDLISPTLVVGHNIFGFDVPFLQLRWRHETPFPFSPRKEVFRVGADVREVNSYVFSQNWVANVVDTYLLAERADALTGGDFPAYGLKQLVSHLFGDTREEKYHQAEDKVAYLVNDLFDTIRLFNYFDFVRGIMEIIPISWDNVLMNTGTMINVLFTTLFSPFFAVPYNAPKKEYQGGYVGLERVGAFDNVYSADVVSMYPNIMLRHVTPKWDKNGLFRGVVQYVLRRRLEAKAKAKSGGEDAKRWQTRQLALKIVANSFYGYLASGGNYSDADSAELVTKIGRSIVKRMCDIITAHGGSVIEVDTDGVYFTAHDPDQVISALRSGIDYDLEFNRYDWGLFVKKKNYALVSEDRLILSGGSLRNRRDNAIYKRIIHDIISLYRTGSPSLSNIWERCYNEYSFYRLKSVPKVWKEGERPLERVVRISERLDNLQKLYNVLSRFSSLPEISHFLKQVGGRATWRKRIELEKQLELPFN